MAVSPPSPPALPLTYPDLVWDLDLDPFASETTSDLQTLQQDVLHLLLQDKGTNLDAPDLGIGITGYLSGSTLALSSIGAVIDQELTKDDRIQASTTTITPPTSTNGNAGVTGYLIEIAIQVSGSVIPLAFTWDSDNGLQPYPGTDPEGDVT